MDLSSFKSARNSLLRRRKKVNAGDVSQFVDSENCCCKGLFKVYEELASDVVALDLAKALISIGELRSSPCSSGHMRLSMGFVEWEYCATGILLLNDLIYDGSLSAIDEAYIILPTLLEDSEPRLRQLCSKSLGCLVDAERLPCYLQNLCKFRAYNTFAPMLLEKARVNFQRELDSRPTNLGKFSSIPLDDTTGWRSLETYLVAYRELIRAYGQDLMAGENIDECVYDLLISQASVHINRYIREFSHSFICVTCDNTLGGRFPSFGSQTTPAVIATKTAAGSGFTDTAAQDTRDENGQLEILSRHQVDFFERLGDRIASALAEGMQDNWSQLRHASLVAAKSYLLSLQSDEARSKYWPKLLPGLSVNRYYVADGVKTPAMDVWTAVLEAAGSKGLEAISTYVEYVVPHYIDMSKAHNHMVSEAACHAMAELAARGDRTAVAPYVLKLITAAEECLRAESWPIRDAASLASGVLLRWYPEQTRSFVATCFDHWKTNLKDAIWSVRENGAIAFGQAMQSTDESLRNEALRVVLSYLDETLEKAREHINPGQSSSSTGKGKGSRDIQFIPPDMFTAMMKRSEVLVRKAATSTTSTGSGTGAGAETASLGYDSPQPPPSLPHGAAGSGSMFPSAASHVTTGPPSPLHVALSSSSSGGSGEVFDDDVFPAAALRRKGWGCCLDCVKVRVSQPWEHSDGALYLLRELAGIKHLPPGTMINHHIDRAWRLLLIEYFDDRSKFRSSLFHILPEIFKRYKAVQHLGDGVVGNDLLLSPSPSSGQKTAPLVSLSGSDSFAPAATAPSSASATEPAIQIQALPTAGPSATGSKTVAAGAGAGGEGGGGGEIAHSGKVGGGRSAPLDISASISLSLGRGRKHQDQSQSQHQSAAPSSNNSTSRITSSSSNSTAKHCIEECSGVVADALHSDYPLEASAAMEFIQEMATIIGPSIITQKIPVEYRDQIVKYIAT